MKTYNITVQVVTNDIRQVEEVIKSMAKYLNPSFSPIRPKDVFIEIIPDDAYSHWYRFERENMLSRDKWIQHEIIMARDKYAAEGITGLADTSVLKDYIEHHKTTRQELVNLAAAIMLQIEKLDEKEGKK